VPDKSSRKIANRNIAPAIDQAAERSQLLLNIHSPFGGVVPWMNCSSGHRRITHLGEHDGAPFFSGEIQQESPLLSPPLSHHKCGFSRRLRDLKI